MESKAEIAGVSLSTRIPDFWMDQPRAWFLQVEAVLDPQKMSDDAKYQVIIAKLGKEVIQQVTDILFDPPATHKYEALKTRLLSIYEESENRRIQRLIGELSLGEQKPSQLLRKMRDLARNKVADDTLVILWRNHLPAPVRAVLAVSDSKDLNTLAAMADQIAENSNPTHIDEVEGQADSQFNKLLAEIARINVRLENMERSRSRGRGDERNRAGPSSFRARSRSRSRGRRPGDADWLCFYHYRYGTKASKCIEPCAWKSKQGN